MSMKPYFKHIARRVLLFLSVGISAAAAQPVQLSVPDTSFTQILYFNLPVYINDVSSLGVTSAQFTLSYNPTALVAQGVVTAGSLSNGWIPAGNVQSGYINVAIAGANPLADSGVLVYVRFKVQKNAPTFTYPLTLSNVLLNDTIGAQIDNGSFAAISRPTITISGLPQGIIGGESAQLTAGGVVPPPYKWFMLSDTNIASIDSLTGLFRAKSRGNAIVTVIDTNGFDGVGNIFVNDFRVSIPDTSTAYNSFIDVPVKFSNVTGLGILSTQFKIEYNTTNVQLTSVILAGTMSSGMAMEYKDSLGKVSFAFSGVTPLSGSGTFVKLRFTPKGLFAANSNTPLNLVQFDANEIGPAYRYAARVGGAIHIMPNFPPVFTNIFDTLTINEDQQFTFNIDATDPEGDTVSYFIQSFPAGMNIDTVTGVLAWRPNFSQAGLYNFVIGAHDGKGGIAARNVGIRVNNLNHAPVFTNKLGNTTISENQPFAFQLAATDADGDSLIFGLFNVPPGMSFDPKQGSISWTPGFTQAGVYTIRYDVGDYHVDGVVSDSAVITVLNVNRLPQFTTIFDSVTITEGQQLTFDVNASDPDGDTLRFFITAAPAGAVIDPVTGVFTWQPTVSQAGIYNFIFGVRDSKPDTVKKNVKITVTDTPASGSPVITAALNDVTINEGQPFSFTYQAADPENDVLTWSLISSPLENLEFTAAGVLSWTPGFFQSGMYTVIVSVSDNTFFVRDTAVITVLNVNRPPVFTALMPDNVIGIDSLFTFQYTASDPDSEQLAFSFVKTRSGAALSAAGLFSWQPLPADLGVDTFIVSVTDGSMSVQDTTFITVFGFPLAEISQIQFDFGSLGIGATKTLSASIKNNGYAPLSVSSLPSPVVNGNFAFDSSSIKNILPGESKSFAVTFAPVSAGTHATLYSFTTNDPLHPFIGITAHGTSVAKAAIKKKILVDRMHNNLAILNDTLMGFGGLFSLARQSGISVSFADTGLHPDSFDILMLIAPLDSYTRNEISRIQNFVSNGGLVIAMGSANASAGTALNSVLKDTAWSTGLAMNNNSVIDTVNNYAGISNILALAAFADTNHPYLTGVDTLLFIRSASVSVTGSAIPFLRTSPFGRAVNVPDSVQPAVIGLSKLGKGKILAIGSADSWTMVFTFLTDPLGIFSKDNLQFAMNVFSVTEDYEVKMPVPTPNETYQLVSIPFDLQNAEITTVLQGLGGVNPLVWRLFGRFDPVAGAYSEFPSENFNTFRRGEAYWLITRGQFNLNFGNATVLPAQDFFPIKIGPGYSMIGNPFPYKVSWTNSLKGDSVQTKLYRFDPAINDFAAETQTLDPFTGYFVKNLSQDSVTIHINPVDVTSLAKQGNTSLLNEGEWGISIGASSGKGRDSENFAGVSPLANVELDKLDAAEPPTTPTDYVSLRFTNPSWKHHGGSYAVDIRPAAEEGIFWDLDVTTAKKQSKVSLSLASIGNLPGDFIVYLVDKKNERAERIDYSSTYDFTMGKNEIRREFRLVAGKKEFVESNTGGIPLTPKDFALGQNFPNPFNPSTTIRYTVGHSGDVSVTIYNLLGQKVRTLMKEFHSIGAYDVEWDARDDNGVLAATGVYFYRITVMSQGERLFNETKKMVLMK